MLQTQKCWARKSRTICTHDFPKNCHGISTPMSTHAEGVASVGLPACSCAGEQSLLPLCANCTGYCGQRHWLAAMRFWVWGLGAQPCISWVFMGCHRCVLWVSMGQYGLLPTCFMGIHEYSMGTNEHKYIQHSTTNMFQQYS